MVQSPAIKTKIRNSLLNWDAHYRFLVASAGFFAVLAGLHGMGTLTTQLIAAWDFFAFVYVLLAWIVLSTKDPYEVRRNASLHDASQTFLFTVVIAAATASLFAVFLLLGASKGLSHAKLAGHVALSLSAIVFSWALVHTLFTLRYAHLYYIDAHKLDRDDIEGGLDFPGEKAPDYLDFAYFSFVIGMTCQVSDVQVSSKKLRRLTLIHGMIAFVFNTAILAMVVNIVAGLI